MLRQMDGHKHMIKLNLTALVAEKRKKLAHYSSMAESNVKTKRMARTACNSVVTTPKKGSSLRKTPQKLLFSKQNPADLEFLSFINDLSPPKTRATTLKKNRMENFEQVCFATAVSIDLAAENRQLKEELNSLRIEAEQKQTEVKFLLGLRSQLPASNTNDTDNGSVLDKIKDGSKYFKYVLRQKSHFENEYKKALDEISRLREEKNKLILAVEDQMVELAFRQPVQSSQSSPEETLREKYWQQMYLSKVQEVGKIRLDMERLKKSAQVETEELWKELLNL